MEVLTIEIRVTYMYKNTLLIASTWFPLEAVSFLVENLSDKDQDGNVNHHHSYIVA